MNAARHTPGPWRVGSGYWICKGKRAVMEVAGNVTDAERQSIVDSLNVDYAMPSDAPDLLAACKAAWPMLDRAADQLADDEACEESGRVADACATFAMDLRAAILKAEGGVK